MEWVKFSDRKPKDGERCLVCNKHHREVSILTFNNHYDCWDGDDGDDFYCDFSNVDYWQPLPNYVD